LLKKGKDLYVQQGPRPALAQFDEALAMFRASHDRHGEAITLGYFANCYRRMEDLDKALGFANQALQLKEELDDRGEVGNTQNQLGLIYWEKADYPAAIDHLQKAIEIAGAVGDKELEGAARNNLGLVFDEKGEYNHSLEQYQRALELNRASHFERAEGDALGNIGGVYLLMGRFHEALPYYQQAFEISERLGLKPASSLDLGNMALCLAGNGDVEGALTNFDRALKIAHESGLPKEEADWRKGKATTLAAVGRYDSALREYGEVERVYEQAGLQRELIEALNDSGNLHALLGDSVTAERQFERALELSRKIGNGSGERASLLALGNLAMRRKRHDSAAADFEQVVKSARAAGDDGTLISALQLSSTNQAESGHLDLAFETALQARQLAEQAGNRPAMAQAAFGLAEARRARGEYAQALDEYSAAETLQNKLPDPELGWRIQYGRGESLESMSRNDDAITAYKQSIHIIETTRADISEERFRAGYIENRYQAYVALVELLLRLHKPDEAFFYSEKLRARAYLDQFRAAMPGEKESADEQRRQDLDKQIHSLRTQVRKEYARPADERRDPALQAFSLELGRAEKEYQEVLDNSRAVKGEAEVPTIPRAADIQSRLPEDVALIEYVIGKQEISTLLITRGSVLGIPVSVSSESLSSRIELLRALITGRKAEWVKPAKGLTQLLLDPLQGKGYLAGIHRLFIVADGVLNYVPFSALPTGNGRFLSDQFTVGYLPSAVALTKNGAAEASSRTLLAMAPTDTQLPNAATEVRDIGRLFPGTSRVIVGKSATETLFKREAEKYDYLHLATHGALNRNAPLLSALEFAPDDQNDGRLELHEIVGMKLHARLVALSACETALGEGYFTEIPAGNEYVGMTQAFLSAGGQSVLASLWPVNDESTQNLMEKFYQLLPKTGGATALARAQQQIRRSDPRFRHPYYWAGFVMVGPVN
jgi:CHAT domain-containing protein/Tfp pilus assembly protein PilF